MKQNNQMIIGAAIALCATMVHGADLAGTAPFQFRYDASLSGLPEEVASKSARSSWWICCRPSDRGSVLRPEGSGHHLDE